MSVQSDLLNAGVGALRDHGGEALTFRALPITGLIDWNPIEATIPSEELVFEPRNMTAIMIRALDITTSPQKGESFLDSSGRYHRIESANLMGTQWRCVCKVSTV